MGAAASSAGHGAGRAAAGAVGRLGVVVEPAADRVVRPTGQQLGVDARSPGVTSYSLAGRAARREPAALRQVDEVGHDARDDRQLVLGLAEDRDRSRSVPGCRGAAACGTAVVTSVCSTISPAYITATRSHISATTPRSWVIRMIAVLVSSRRRRIRSRIWAWIVTSSAVVGSSAMSSSGSQASAMAIITRCAMPPDISCGNALRRRSGSGMPTICMHLDGALLARRCFFMPRWIAEDLADLAADRPDRVQRRGRLLEDHRDPVAADLAHLLVGELRQVVAVER